MMGCVFWMFAPVMGCIKRGHVERVGGRGGREGKGDIQKGNESAFPEQPEEGERCGKRGHPREAVCSGMWKWVWGRNYSIPSPFPLQVQKSMGRFINRCSYKSNIYISMRRFIDVVRKGFSVSQSIGYVSYLVCDGRFFPTTRWYRY